MSFIQSDLLVTAIDRVDDTLWTQAAAQEEYSLPLCC